MFQPRLNLFENLFKKQTLEKCRIRDLQLMTSRSFGQFFDPPHCHGITVVTKLLTFSCVTSFVENPLLYSIRISMTSVNNHVMKYSFCLKCQESTLSKLLESWSIKIEYISHHEYPPICEVTARFSNKFETKHLWYFWFQNVLYY